jgi:hypothetical protein
MDKLETMLMIGQMAKNMFEARQAAFMKSNPYLTETESTAADLLQRFIVADFNKKVEEKKKELDGMDLLELRLWAPDAKCALMQLHEYITKEYGLFPVIGLTSGMAMIAKDKLFFIAIAIRKIKKEEMFGEKNGDETREGSKSEENDHP